MNDFCIQLDKELDEQGIYLEEDILSQLKGFSDMVLETNEFLNLTNITEESEVITKQFVDCLVSLPILDKYHIQSVLDIGSGAGFPSFPLGIARPQIKVHSVDALQKRINFQNQVIDVLNLRNISSFHNRAETMGQDGDYREQYDAVVSRAVTGLSVLLEYMSPFVKVNGYVIAYKGKNYEAELDASKNAQEILNLEFVEAYKVTLRDNQERCLLIFKKTSSTPSKYPRKNGLPNKKPL